MRYNELLPNKDLNSGTVLALNSFNSLWAHFFSSRLNFILLKALHFFVLHRISETSFVTITDSLQSLYIDLISSMVGETSTPIANKTMPKQRRHCQSSSPSRLITAVLLISLLCCSAQALDCSASPNNGTSSDPTQCNCVNSTYYF